jgi:hypothetical protein
VKRAIRSVTKTLVEAFALDVWPDSPAVIVDFGIDSQSHYEALHGPVRAGEISADELDAALGNGVKLTALVRAAPSNPHKNIIFKCGGDAL